MARTDNFRNFLTDVANAIREKKGTTDTIPASNFDTEIASIDGSGSGKYVPRHILFREYTGTDLNEEISNLDTSNIVNMTDMFYSCQNITSIDISQWNTSNVTSMKEMFGGCNNLTNVNVSNLDTSKVVDISLLFNTCSKLTSLDLSTWDVSNVNGTGLDSTFSSCTSLENLNINNWKISNITSLSGTFANCTKIKSLDLSDWDVSQVTNATRFLVYAYALTSLNIDGWDTSKIKSASNMFYGCKFTSLPQLDASSMTSISSIFTSCSNLTDFGGLKDLGKAYLTTTSANSSNYTLNLSGSAKLTHDSLMNIINNLYDIKTNGCNTQKLVLGTTNLAKLTTDEIGIATNKGWTVS